MPALSNEDQALKSKLSGLTVYNGALAKNTDVAVKYTIPEDELSDITYPLIAITQAAMNRDPEREARGFVELRSVPEGFDITVGPWFAELPVPYNLDYQIVLYTRLMEHRTELVRTLAGFDYLPERYGYLDVPQDNTVRRLDLLGGPELSAGRDSNNKRLFTAAYRIRVSTELFVLGDPVTYPTVSQVDLALDDTVPGNPG